MLAYPTMPTVNFLSFFFCLRYLFCGIPICGHVPEEHCNTGYCKSTADFKCLADE